MNPERACIDDLNRKTFKGDDSGQTIKAEKFGLIAVNITLPDSCTDTGWRFFADVTFKGIDQVKDSYESLPEGIMAVVPDVKP